MALSKATQVQFGFSGRELINGLFEEIVALTGIDDRHFMPMDIGTYGIITKEEVVELFDNFSAEILRLYGMEKKRFVVREYHCDGFVMALARNILGLETTIDRVNYTPKVTWAYYAENKLPRSKLLTLLHGFQNLILHRAVDRAVIYYCDAIADFLVSELGQGRIGSELITSLRGKLRIGTQVITGTNYLLHEIALYPEIYSVIIFWTKRLNLGVELLEELKNHLIHGQELMGQVMAEDYYDGLARKFLEERGYDLVGLLPAN